MTVEVVARSKSFQQPTKGFYALVGQIRLVMDTPRRRMADKDVQIASVPRSIPEQAGDYTQDMRPHLGLSVLKWTLAVTKTAFYSSQDQTLLQNNFAV
jgi:hypothetical protein